MSPTDQQAPVAIAIDWSGARYGERRKIWCACAASGGLRGLSSGRSREEVIADLMVAAEVNANLVVGLDFAFSMPEWFVREAGATSGPEFWRVVEEHGEGWLDAGRPPFFGRKGTMKPSGVELFRRTDLAVPKVAGRAPSSAFQLAGPSQVGPGSIRGMPLLRRLAERGFRIWPFDLPEPGAPLVVEIYPRLLTGPVVKTDLDARREALAGYAGAVPRRLRELAASGDDPFDAALSAIGMDRHLDELRELAPGDEVDRIEGRIWHPAALGVSGSAPGSA